MAETEVLMYISDLLGDAVLPVEEVFSGIADVPAEIQQPLEQQCRTVEQMEEFLRSHSDYFIVENKRVGTYDVFLATGQTKAIDYFKDILRFYNEPPNYVKLRSHIARADEDVIDFINCFYPGEEFRDFLLGHPDVFVLFENGSVYLVENESVDYFENCLSDFGDGLSVVNLRAHVSQAPHHVINFINRRYPGRKFLEFLEENSDVFDVQNGYVYLIPDEQ